MDFKALHEELKEASKFLYESNEYKLTIITGRDRDSDGELTKESFKAKNDLEALLYVFKTYDLQNAGMFNGTYEDGDWDEEDEQLRQNILNCVKENKIEEGIKLLTDLYFDGFDISDYYDDIVKLEAPDGHVVFEDTNLDIEGWFEGEDSISDEEELHVSDLDRCLQLLYTVKTNMKVVDNKEFFIVDEEKSNNRLTCNLALKDSNSFDDVIASVTIYGEEPQETAFTINLYLDGQNKLIHKVSIDEIEQTLKDNWNVLLQHNKNRQ